MTRQRDTRESQALRFLVERKRATAVDIGTAAVHGEDHLVRWKGREVLGLSLGMHFVKRGFARVNRFNTFEWIPPAGQ